MDDLKLTAHNKLPDRLFLFFTLLIEIAFEKGDVTHCVSVARVLLESGEHLGEDLVDLLIVVFVEGKKPSCVHVRMRHEVDGDSTVCLVLFHFLQKS